MSQIPKTSKHPKTRRTPTPEEQAQFYRVLIDRIGDGLLLINTADGTILDANETICFNLGYTRDELLQLSIFDIDVILCHLGQLRAHVERLFSSGCLLIHGEYIKRDKTTFPAEIRMTYSEFGVDTTMVAVVRDITQRKKAEAKVSALQEAVSASSRLAGISEVATGILHNVGNCLNSVAVSSHLVLERLNNSAIKDVSEILSLLPTDKNKAIEYLKSNQGEKIVSYLLELCKVLDGDRLNILEEMDQLTNSVEHLKHIISTQQKFAKSSTQEMVSPNYLIDEALRITKALIPTDTITITTKAPQIRPHLMESNQVLQILVNLLKNACESVQSTTHADKEIQIRISDNDDIILFEVKDNGLGISKEVQQRLFTPGFTTKALGHGFGLSTSVHVAQQMGGKLTCISDGSGLGACFRLTIPSRINETEPKIPTSIATCT